jgi:hypothetical protein
MHVSPLRVSDFGKAGVWACNSSRGLTIPSTRRTEGEMGLGHMEYSSPVRLSTPNWKDTVCRVGGRAAKAAHRRVDSSFCLQTYVVARN